MKGTTWINKVNGTKCFVTNLLGSMVYYYDEYGCIFRSDIEFFESTHTQVV